MSARGDLQPTAESDAESKRRLILKIGGLLDELREVARRDRAADSLLADISAFRGNVLRSLIGAQPPGDADFPTIRMGAVPGEDPIEQKAAVAFG